MRCPKCGYISFDQQETCSKCGKGINLDKVGITGTVFDVPPPNFLNMEGDESETDFIEGFDQTFSDNDETEIINDLDMGALSGDSGDIEEEEDFEFDMGESDLDEMDLNALEDSDETAELALTGFEEEDETLELEEAGGTISMEDELELDFGEEPEAADEEMLNLQMEDEEPAKPLDEESPEFTIDDDLDFSDLKGPEEDELIFGDDEETITLDDMEAPAAPREQVAQPAASSTKTDANLEDLQFEGIKLEDSSISAPPADKPKSAPKNVKTGTALDDFEIDLGDLFSEDE